MISDLTLLPESVVNAELDSEENSESIVETTDDLPTDSMTIGELADQKHPSNRIVAVCSLISPLEMTHFIFDRSMIFQQEKKSIPIQHVFLHSNRKAMVRRHFLLSHLCEIFV